VEGMKREGIMNRTKNIGVNIVDLYKAFTPMIASQLLCAYYTFLLHSRAEGDERPEAEIFKDVLSDFLTVSNLIEQSIDSLDQIDREKLLVTLKTLRSKR
jgi:hypothetical protein